MKDERGPWYLLTGLFLGLVFGLLYARVINPLDRNTSAPAMLKAEHQDRYRAMIAVAYLANNDLVRARARLALLGDADPYAALANQAQRALGQEGDGREARALGLLAIALGKENGQGAPAGGSILPSFTPAPTSPPAPPASATSPASPQPSATPPVATPAPPLEAQVYVLAARQRVCTQPLEKPLLQVHVSDAVGQPAPGVEVTVLWEGGEESFFTGLKPEMGSGYADFSLEPGIVYSLRLAGDETLLSDIEAVECSFPGGTSGWGAWLLTFTPP